MEKFGNRMDQYFEYLIREFYQFNSTPLLEALAGDVIWSGPFQGQILGYEDLMRNTFFEGGFVHHFSLENMETRLIKTGRKHCEVLALFQMTIYYKNGKIDSLRQRYHIHWKKEEEWRMQVVSISNFAPLLSDTTLEKADTPDDSTTLRNGDTSKNFPIDIATNTAPLNVTSPSEDLTAPEGRHLVVKERGTGFTYSLNTADILYIESVGHTSVIHLQSRSINVTASLKILEGKTNGYLIRCHSGYMVNPFYVESISRFKLVLTTGTHIPVPEKKYTRIKQMILDSHDSRQ